MLSLIAVRFLYFLTYPTKNISKTDCLEWLKNWVSKSAQSRWIGEWIMMMHDDHQIVKKNLQSLGNKTTHHWLSPMQSRRQFIATKVWNRKKIRILLCRTKIQIEISLLLLSGAINWAKKLESKLFLTFLGEILTIITWATRLIRFMHQHKICRVFCTLMAFYQN